MRLISVYSLFLGFMLFSSCSEKHAFTQTHVIADQSWSYDQILKYEFEITEVKSLYDLYLEIEYLTSFPYQNFYVNVFTGQDGLNLKKTQLSLELSNKLGIRKGNCSDDKCSYLMPLQKSIFFENAGKQKFWIEQASRDAILNGIESIKLVGNKIGERTDLKPVAPK